MYRMEIVHPLIAPTFPGNPSLGSRFYLRLRLQKMKDLQVPFFLFYSNENLILLQQDLGLGECP